MSSKRKGSAAKNDNVFQSFILYLKEKCRLKYAESADEEISEFLKKKNKERMMSFSGEKSLVLFILLNSIVRSQLWKKQTFTNYIIGTKKGWATPIDKSSERKSAEDVVPPFRGEFANKEILEHDYFLRMVYIDCMLDDVDLWLPDNTLYSKSGQKSFNKIREELRQNYPDIGEDELDNMVRKQIKDSTTRAPSGASSRASSSASSGASSSAAALAAGVPNGPSLDCPCDFEQSQGGGGINNINQKGGMRLKSIFRIVQIATYAFLWGIISNNYYERLETFGPQISILIKQNYQDVLTPHIGEMTELKSVLQDIQLRVRDSEEGVDVHDSNPSHSTALVDADADADAAAGENILDADKIRRMNSKHLDTETDRSGVELSYGTIAEYLGVSYYQATFGSNNVDLINEIEKKVTTAVTQDVINIVNRRITTMQATPEETGNSNTALTKLGNVVTDLIAGFFHSSNSNYRNAPGVGDTVEATLRRAQQIRRTWARWQESYAESTDNFVRDVLLHIRTTSYYLWAYFIGMQALEVAAVRAFYKLLVRRRPDGAAAAVGGEEKQMALTDGSTSQLIDRRVQEMEENICRQTGAHGPTVRSVK